MRKLAACLVLCGCFSEPERVDTSIGVTTASTTASGEESSSGSSSESEGGSDSGSSETTFDPRACPEWCNPYSCDSILFFERCRCTNDAICSLGGFTCHDEENGNGHCY